jgi:tetrahydromethanopterin S-methyltransferase subunit A
MGESWSARLGELKSWAKDAMQKAEGEIDTDAIMGRIRDVVGNIDKEVDSEAIMARVKETVAKAEGAVDAEKLKQWVDEVDAEKIKTWIAEGRAKAGMGRDDV